MLYKCDVDGCGREFSSSQALGGHSPWHDPESKSGMLSGKLAGKNHPSYGNPQWNRGRSYSSRTKRKISEATKSAWRHAEVARKIFMSKKNSREFQVSKCWTPIIALNDREEEFIRFIHDLPQVSGVLGQGYARIPITYTDGSASSYWTDLWSWDLEGNLDAWEFKSESGYWDMPDYKTDAVRDYCDQHDIRFHVVRSTDDIRVSFTNLGRNL